MATILDMSQDDLWNHSLAEDRFLLDKLNKFAGSNGEFLVLIAWKARQ
jgi:hypothetical protein